MRLVCRRYGGSEWCIVECPLGGGQLDKIAVARMERVPCGSIQQIAIPYVVYHVGVQGLAQVRSGDSSFAIESSARYWYASAILCGGRV